MLALKEANCKYSSVDYDKFGRMSAYSPFHAYYNHILNANSHFVRQINTRLDCDNHIVFKHIGAVLSNARSLVYKPADPVSRSMDKIFAVSVALYIIAANLVKLGAVQTQTFW